MTILENPLIPRDRLPTVPQLRFLTLEGLDALYGGAAGGGKSDALLMAALQFCELPGYAALLMRRSFADLALPGALMDRAREWLSGKARWNTQEHRWRFPSGSTLQFGYCDRDSDVYRYQSSEFQFIGLDEATQFSEFQMRFLFSRLRRRHSIPVPLRFRLASNPGGVGHEWVKKRYVNPGTVGKEFVPARLTDNPHLDQDAYRLSLAELDPFTRMQLLNGDWDAVPGGRFHDRWFGRFTQTPDGDLLLGDRRIPWDACWRFQTADTAASTSTAADYTVISTWAVTPDNQLVWLHCHRQRLEVPDIAPLVLRLYQRWDVQFLVVEAVAAHSGLGVYQQLRRLPVAVRPVRPVGDPLVNSHEAQTLASTGRVWVPARAGWLDDCLTEVLRFTGDEKKDAFNDVVATLSYAARVVTRKDAVAGAAPRARGGMPRG